MMSAHDAWLWLEVYLALRSSFKKLLKLKITVYDVFNRLFTENYITENTTTYHFLLYLSLQRSWK